MKIDLSESIANGVAPWIDELSISTDTIAVYADQYPVTLGHLLFVPRYNTQESITQAFSYALQQGEKLVSENRCDSYNVGINQGTASGQTINYPCVHLIPRNIGDCEDPIGGIRRCVDGQGNYRITSYINPLNHTTTNLIDGQILPEFLHLYDDIVSDIDCSDSVPGLISQEDVNIINEIAGHLPKNSTVVEIGSFLGKSSVAWANCGFLVYCIDFFQMPADLLKEKLITGYGSIPQQIADAKTQLDIFNYYTSGHNITAIPRKFDRKFNWTTENISCVFDDSDHTEETLGLVFKYWWPKLAVGGYLCGHDYDWPDVLTTVQFYARIFNVEVITWPNSSMWAVKKDKK
jgi:diadenosine tetraphosphate (Ap4A) HIT family hydrolase/cephalosporin hydroxylase